METPQGFAKEALFAESVGLPPPAWLVDLALAPFKRYRKNLAEGTGGGDLPPGKETPPVVKLNLSFLGFESVGPVAARGRAPPGQRRLTDIMVHRQPEAAAACVNHRSAEPVNR